MMFEPAETIGTPEPAAPASGTPQTRTPGAPQPPAAKAKPCILALVIGAATIIYVLVADLRSVISGKVGVPGEAVGKSIPLMLSASLPWFGAGIALVVRAVRGALCWARAIASWAGGFFIGAIGLIAGVAFLTGPHDSMTWLFHTLGFTLFLILGIVLLKIGFKRS